VKYFTRAAVNKRPCTVIQVVHPTPRDVFRFHLARVFVDNELKLPIRYESYDWPREPSGEPRLIEEYTYLDLKLNNGFTDEDFSTRNTAYQFRQSAAVLGQSADAR
jgi:negative regulator of sigma E activity